MVLRPLVQDALVDWEIQFRKQAALVNYEEMHPQSDEFRVWLLDFLHRYWCVTFDDWCVDEVFMFCLVAYPRNNILKLTSIGKSSKFFDLMHTYWMPNLTDWLHLLWRFSGPAHGLFGDMLFLYNRKHNPSPKKLGLVLFSDMLKQGVYYEESIPSVVGALVTYAIQSTRVFHHAQQIFQYCEELTPYETGLACRALLIYRAVERNGCQCGYGRRERSCICAEGSDQSDGISLGIDLKGDKDKEYALVFARTIIHHFSSIWNRMAEDEFIRSFCEYIFSEGTYKELFQNLRQGRIPTKKQMFPRYLTKDEERINFVRTSDLDFNHGYDQHAGCVQHNCKQASKKGCTNSCCMTHCMKLATQDCQNHNVFTVTALTYFPRKNITMSSSDDNKRNVLQPTT